MYSIIHALAAVGLIIECVRANRFIHFIFMVIIDEDDGSKLYYLFMVRAFGTLNGLVCGTEQTILVNFHPPVIVHDASCAYPRAIVKC